MGHAFSGRVFSGRVFSDHVLKHTAIGRGRRELPLRGTHTIQNALALSPTEWGLTASAPNSRVVYNMVPL